MDRPGAVHADVGNEAALHHIDELPRDAGPNHVPAGQDQPGRAALLCLDEPPGRLMEEVRGERPHANLASEQFVVDGTAYLSKNTVMSTDVEQSEALADLEALCSSLAAGRPVDPDLAKRIRERSERIREEIRRKHGVLDVAVQLIREAREE
ncbi:MAG: hypothetical protein HYS13_02605 [Planctomycetia bacterium]|nr:hypothetical protein [Planctomycetia bacterium]